MSKPEDVYDLDLALRSCECQEYLDETRQALLGRTIVDISFSNEGSHIATYLHLDDNESFYIMQPSLDVETIRDLFELVIERERQLDLARQEAEKAKERKPFIVGIREVHFRYYEVEAENEEQAKDLVNQRSPQAIDLEFTEYANELDRDTWSVEQKSAS